MVNGEAYYFRVWDSTALKEYAAKTTFLSGINAYVPNAIEVIQSLMLCSPTDTTITVVACNSYFWNNQTYNSSGIYTQTQVNVAGCDSSITLHLTINQTPNVLTSNQGLRLVQDKPQRY